MTTDIPFDAYLGDWKPPQSDIKSLDIYLEGRKSEIQQSVNGKEDWSQYLYALQRHFGRMKRFLQSEGTRFQNLVFGNIQSGKTAHILANICWAKDNGVDLVVVFGGATTPLIDQTYDRLGRDLPPGTAEITIVPTERSTNAIEELIRNLQVRVTSRARDKSEPIPVLVLIKNTNRLGTMEQIVNPLQSRFVDALDVMIIDDEADQGSPDATLRGTRSRRSIRRGRTIHSGIGSVTTAISGKRIYLAYTATPQALLHGALSNALQPQYCTVIPVSSDYTGIGEVVDCPGVLVSVESRFESSSNLTDDEKNSVCLEQCFAEFLVLSWVHRETPQLFHRRTGLPERNCEHDSVQMLIHPSHLQDRHHDYARDVQELVKTWIGDLSSGSRRKEFIDTYFIPAYKNVLKKFNTSEVRELQSKSSDCLDYIFIRLKTPELLQIKTVNTDTRMRLRSQSREIDFLPTKTTDWAGKDWILIGGDILGRGLTIPHLVTTFFLRNPRSPNFDVSLQQMRFCGYRRDYLHLTTVLAPNDIVEDYEAAAWIERALRSRAKKWDENNRDLLTDPPALRFEAPPNSRFNPTRNSVTSVEVRSRDIGNTGFFGLWRIGERSRFQANLKVLTELVKNATALNSVDSYSFVELNAKEASNLINSLSVDNREAGDIAAFRELLGYPSEALGFSEQKVVVVFDSEFLNQVIAPDATNREIRLDDLVKSRFTRTLRFANSLDFSSWNDESSKSLWRDTQVSTLVGDSERRVLYYFQDRVVIHFRQYALFGNAENKERPLGLGISSIGWIPIDQNRVWIHEEAISEA